MAKKIPVNHVKAMGLFVPLKPQKDLVRKDGDFGTYNETYKEIVFDPDTEPEGTIIHEDIHVYRHILGLSIKDSVKDEAVVNITEQAIVDFVVNNPRLARWLVDGLIAKSRKYKGR